MSAEVLREAATAIRFDATDPDGPWADLPSDLALAVADWLDGCADRREATSDARIEYDLEEQDWYSPALAVATAYLGSAS